jgi:hypothetical protein
MGCGINGKGEKYRKWVWDSNIYMFDDMYHSRNLEIAIEDFFVCTDWNKTYYTSVDYNGCGVFYFKNGI